MRYSEKWPQYARQWDTMAIKPMRAAEFGAVARFAIEHRGTYIAIAAASGVPWALIAVLHRRESDPDKQGNPRFDTYLGNGQPLSRKTTLVPKGRGPFRGPNAFIDGAIDALKIDGLASVTDWRLEKMLYYCELFNGTGYHNRGLPSPYIWGGTNIQQAGKFTETVRGSTFRPGMWDAQPGCAPMLMMIAKLDPSVSLVREA